MSKIGMVILNYNDYETTYDMIQQIKDYKILDHIVIVDNNRNTILNKSEELIRNKNQI